MILGTLFSLYILTDMNDIYHRVGCICCLIDGHGWTPPEMHHVRRLGGKRELCEILPLCAIHHRTGIISLHGAKKSFRAKYGDERVLLELVAEEIEKIRGRTI